MSRRTWRRILTPKYEAPARAVLVVMTSSSSHRAGGQAERDPALDEQEEDHDRDRDQRGGGHDLAPVDEAVAAVEIRQPDGDRLRAPVVEQRAREDVLVPASDERKHGRRDETGGDEREEDPDEGAKPRRPVDHRGLLE